MLSAYWRHGLIVALALLTTSVMATARPTARAAAAPSATQLIAGTGWRQVGNSYLTGWAPSWWHREWQLGDARGSVADLYLERSTMTKSMLRWSGELSYEGQGYQSLLRDRQILRLPDGTTAPASVLVVQHLANRYVLAYAVVSPNSVTARSTDNLLDAAWDIVHGGGPYYMVRVSVPAYAASGDAAARATATRLLAPVLSTLRADVQREK